MKSRAMEQTALSHQSYSVRSQCGPGCGPWWHWEELLWPLPRLPVCTPLPFLSPDFSVRVQIVPTEMPSTSPSPGLSLNPGSATDSKRHGASASRSLSLRFFTTEMGLCCDRPMR